MNLLFDESFERSIKKLNNKRLKKSITDLLIAFEQAERLFDVPNIKKMQAFKNITEQG